jgi:cytidylate kinase
MKIIAFSGKKQAGKTTAAENLAARLGYAKIEFINFGDEIKGIARRCFGATYQQTDGTDDQKNTICENGYTVRELMQQLGVMLKSIDPAAITNAYLWRVIQQPYNSLKIIITADVRTPAEALLVQRVGGVVIRLSRAPHAETDRHSSETALDGWKVRHGGVMVMAFGVEEPGKPYRIENEIIEIDRSESADEGFDALIDNANMDVKVQSDAIWKLVCERNWL